MRVGSPRGPSRAAIPRRSGPCDRTSQPGGSRGRNRVDGRLRGMLRNVAPTASQAGLLAGCRGRPTALSAAPTDHPNGRSPTPQKQELQPPTVEDQIPCPRDPVPCLVATERIERAVLAGSSDHENASPSAPAGPREPAEEPANEGSGSIRNEPFEGLQTSGSNRRRMPPQTTIQAASRSWARLEVVEFESVWSLDGGAR